MCTRNHLITTAGSVPARLGYTNVMCTRNYLITTTGLVPIKLPQSSLEQTNTNTKWHANFVFEKSSQNTCSDCQSIFIFKLNTSSCKQVGGGGEGKIQNQYIFTNTPLPIYTTFVHVIKYSFLQTDCRYS